MTASKHVSNCIRSTHCSSEQAIDRPEDETEHDAQSRYPGNVHQNRRKSVGDHIDEVIRVLLDEVSSDERVGSPGNRNHDGREHRRERHLPAWTDDEPQSYRHDGHDHVLEGVANDL